MTRLPLYLALLLSGLNQSAIASTESCQRLNDDEVLALFAEWNARIQAADPAQVAALYQQDALLLPTVSSQSRDNRLGHIEYFDSFLRKRPSGALTDTYIYSGCEQATLAGSYVFTFAATGERVPARFTFNYRYADGQWLIAHHHSSLLPAD